VVAGAGSAGADPSAIAVAVAAGRGACAAAEVGSAIGARGSPICIAGGRPGPWSLVRHGCQRIAKIKSTFHCSSNGNRRTARDLKIPAAVEQIWASVKLSRPIQHVANFDCSAFTKCAPGLIAKIHSPINNIGCWYFLPRYFSYGVMFPSDRFRWYLLCSHAA